MELSMAARDPMSLASTDEQGTELEESKLVLEAMRDLAEKQLERAERVRAAARQTFVYVSTLFAVGQAVAFGGFAARAVTPTEQTVVLITGIMAAIVLCVTGVLVVCTDKLKTITDVAPDDILTEAQEALERNEEVADRLTKLYVDSATAREEAVSSRRGLATLVTALASVTVVLVLVEIILSLVSRLP